MTWDLIGHEWAVQLLQGHIENKTLRHAYLITGPSDIGKKNLAIRFSVYKSESLPYDSVTRSFSEIKPTDSQYRKLLFRGISCSGIHHIQVEDPGRCSMGDLDRFSAQPGDCIEHIRVERNELVNIAK